MLQKDTKYPFSLAKFHLIYWAGTAVILLRKLGDIAKDYNSYNLEQRGISCCHLLSI